MLYGQRRGELRGAEKRRLNEFEMKCLRRMAGVTRMDIMSGMSVTNLNRGVEVRLLEWFGHMDRNDGGRFSARMISSKVQGNLDGNRGMVDSLTTKTSVYITRVVVHMKENMSISTHNTFRESFPGLIHYTSLRPSSLLCMSALERESTTKCTTCYYILLITPFSDHKNRVDVIIICINIK